PNRDRAAQTQPAAPWATSERQGLRVIGPVQTATNDQRALEVGPRLRVSTGVEQQPGPLFEAGEQQGVVVTRELLGLGPGIERVVEVPTQTLARRGVPENLDLQGRRLAHGEDRGFMQDPTRALVVAELRVHAAELEQQRRTALVGDGLLELCAGQPELP